MIFRSSDGDRVTSRAVAALSAPPHIANVADARLVEFLRDGGTTSSPATNATGACPPSPRPHHTKSLLPAFPIWKNW